MYDSTIYCTFTSFTLLPLFKSHIAYIYTRLSANATATLPTSEIKCVTSKFSLESYEQQLTVYL